MTRNFIVATAGHVDHGKSALVKALTGTDPDRLPEEKARGITIDLGFAHLRLQDADGTDLELGLVDVPGHEDFVKNMVAGVGATDLALLIVAADDGWMPQTEEHLQILWRLGVPRAVVAVTKIDRVSAERVAVVVRDVQTRLAGTPFGGASISPVSALTGAGVEALRAHLVGALQAAEPPEDVGRPRLWIDRVFSLRGVGTVVTGTLTGGTLRVGQEVALGGRSTTLRIRGLQSYHAPRDQVFPGARVALNLVGSGGSDADAHALRRGDLIMAGANAPATACTDVWLEPCTRSGRPAVLRHGTLVHVHVGTAVMAARVIFADPATPDGDGPRLAQLRLAQRLPLRRGDRFILRDAAGRVTLAGGVVLDAEAGPKRFRSAAQQAFLAAVATSPRDAVGAVTAQLARDRFMERARLVAVLPFHANAVEDAIRAVCGRGGAVDLGTVISSTPAWNELERSALAAVDAHHRAHPAQNGLPVAQLRGPLAKRGVPDAALDVLLAHLTRQRCEAVGAALRRREFRPTLPPGTDAAAAELRRILRRTQLAPPCRSELASSPARSLALEYLVKTGEAVALGPDIVIAAEAYTDAVASIRRYLAARTRGTVSELKQALQSTRRVVVPLLEKTDHNGITQREGEFRTLRPGRAGESAGPMPGDSGALAATARATRQP